MTISDNHDSDVRGQALVNAVEFEDVNEVRAKLDAGAPINY